MLSLFMTFMTNCIVWFIHYYIQFRLWQAPAQ